MLNCTWHVQAVGLVDKILRERADDIIDMDKAVRRVEAERHHQLPSGADEVRLVIRLPSVYRIVGNCLCKMFRPLLYGLLSD